MDSVGAAAPCGPWGPSPWGPLCMAQTPRLAGGKGGVNSPGSSSAGCHGHQGPSLPAHGSEVGPAGCHQAHVPGSKHSLHRRSRCTSQSPADLPGASGVGEPPSPAPIKAARPWAPGRGGGAGAQLPLLTGASAVGRGCPYTRAPGRCGHSRGTACPPGPASGAQLLLIFNPSNNQHLVCIRRAALYHPEARRGAHLVQSSPPALPQSRGMALVCVCTPGTNVQHKKSMKRHPSCPTPCIRALCSSG